MPYSPPRWLESLGSVLVPPASAEHALGDLAECSRSRATYVRTLVSILPRVIWSQVRRRATLGGVILHALLTAGALLAFQGLPTSSFFGEPVSPPRLAPIWGIWVVGCALAAAYGPRETPRAWSRRVFFATIVGAVGAAFALGVPWLRVVMSLSAVYGTLLVLSMPWLTATTPPPLSLDTLADHARHFQRGIWWRNTRESLACAVVLALNAHGLWQAETTLDRVGKLLLMAGVAFIMCFLHLRAASRAVPVDADVRTIWQFHRRELARQRDILRAIVWWYLMPFVPGMVVLAFGNRVTSAPAAIVGMLVVFGVFALIWRLNLWGARWLDGELQKVEGLEGQL